MSPVASGGPPHTRASSTNGGPVTMANGAKANIVAGLKASEKHFAHLDDLVAAKPNASINSPIRTIIQEGEVLAKQAATYLDFRRPDLALQEYVKASTIAVDIIPHHKDYPSLPDQGELYRTYIGLKKRINSQNQRFMEAKEEIKANNVRSGVKPMISRENEAVVLKASNGVAHGYVRAASVPVSNGNVVNGTPPRKQPPPIQPKPDALHGKAIQNAGQGKNHTSADLAARFSRLRGSDAGMQDPRIRTHLIEIPAQTESTSSSSSSGIAYTSTRPTGPRDMPSIPKAPTRPIVDIPTMPRAPDAIYSPARGTETAATINLPSSIARNSSYPSNGRKDSAPPISTVGPTPNMVDNRPDYFSLAPNAIDNDFARAITGQKTSIPDSTTVSAETLFEYLQQGSSSLRILLVDLRSRDEFEQGHILTQSTICVEPITLRHGISGEELEDCMVIAPDYEQSLYEQRQDFDLVVYYDQSSTCVASSSPALRDANTILRDFSAAVYEYGYDKQLKRRPMLLVGGLEAWVDLLGPSSLKSSVADGVVHAGAKGARTLTRTSLSRDVRKMPITRRKTRSSRPLTNEEEIRWNETIREESTVHSPAEPAASEEFVYARTTEDFFRRYPELPSIQESMVSQVVARPTERNHHDELVKTMPRPPARPPPALPRQRSWGITERGPTPIASYAHTIEPSITASRVSPGLTGLVNPHNLCYLNCTLQAMSATPWLRDYLKGFTFPPISRLPRKGDEKTDPPQLLVRILGNLLAVLWGGQYDYVSPKTFSEYVNSVHAKSISAGIRSMAYGGPNRQHDAAEFGQWMLEILDDEMNPGRNIPVDQNFTDAEVRQFGRVSLLQSCISAWDMRKPSMWSPIAEEMRSQMAFEIICRKCHFHNRRFQTQDFLTLNLRDQVQEELLEVMKREWGKGSEKELDEYRCELGCGAHGVKASRTEYLSYLPNTIVIQLNRYAAGSTDRVNTALKFPEYGLDISACFPADDHSNAKLLPGQQKNTFKYDVYAVQQHEGTSRNSGHYWTLSKSYDKPARDGIGKSAAGAWHKFNDTKVTDISFEQTQNKATTVIWFRKQGTYKKSQ